MSVSGVSFDNNVGIIGTGNMGFALLKGYRAAVNRGVVFAYDTNPDKAAVAEAAGAVFAADEAAVVTACKYVVLACKPQQLAEVLIRIAPAVSKNTVIVSICAGISVEFIKGYVGDNARVVLVMPNTPMLLNKGASAVARGANVSDTEFEFVKSIIGSCGIVEEVPLDKMKEIIPVNGSSPAFIYLYAQYFIEYAAEQGIDRDVAARLFGMSLIGAGEMILNSGFDLDTLIEQVSSKGGTTVAGLARLREEGLDKAVREACTACVQRAYTLSS